jgi:hypothetical protein
LFEAIAADAPNNQEFFDPAKRGVLGSVSNNTFCRCFSNSRESFQLGDCRPIDVDLLGLSSSSLCLGGALGF